jgi:hypothetical protein
MIQTLNKRKTLTVRRLKASEQDLAQQKSDFTSEGAPPPGHVATAVPSTAAVPSLPGEAPAGAGH